MGPLESMAIASELVAGESEYGAQNGSRPILPGVMMRCQESLLRVASRITGDSGCAEDIVQDTFLTILQNGATFKGASSPETYLYRIVINKSIDERRKNRRRRAMHGAMQWEQAPAEVPEQEAASNRALVRVLLDSIPDKFRVPLMLAEFEGLSYEEIAHMLNISLNTVCTRIFRGREKLRRALEKTGWTL
jgi:RNA polymerase sigma-70 factor, ECF subfamily